MVQGILPADVEHGEGELYLQMTQAFENKKTIYLQEFCSMGEQLRNVINLASRSGKPPEIVLIEIQTFYQVTLAIEALKAQKTVCLNLSLVNAETAQRIMDFLMGGAYAIDCQPSCIGEEVFLLTPDRVVLSQLQEQE